MIAVLNKTYRKNILREIQSSKSRFISFFGIVMLGVMILTGLMSVAPDMRAAGNAYFAAQRLCDIRILSTLGLSEADITAIAQTEGVEAVCPAKTLDAEATDQKGDTLVLRLQSLPAGDAPINTPVLREGRMPTAPGECAAHGLGFVNDIHVGSVLRLQKESDAVAMQEYTVVGLVQDPTHFSIDAESSTAGDGNLDVILFVPENTFTTDYYTTCFLTVEEASALDSYSDAYEEQIRPVRERLEATGEGRSILRREQLVVDAKAKLADANAEYEQNEAKARQEFAEAERKLADAQVELNAAKRKLNQGERDYQDGQRQLEAQRQALPATLENGAQQILVNEAAILELDDRVQEIKLAAAMLEVAQPMLDYAAQLLEAAQKRLDAVQNPPEQPEPGSPIQDAVDRNLAENLEFYERELAAAQQLYASAEAQVATYQAQLDAAKQQLFAAGYLPSPEISNLQLAQDIKEILRKMKLALSEGKLSISLGTATAYTELEKAEKALAEARQTLDGGWAEYNAGTEAWEAGRAELAEKKAEAEKQLADGRRQIVDAEERIDDIANGEWYVLGRDSIVCCVTFAQNADRIAAIAKVFPIFFFLVAALVATTTMTRMVDENRLQLGALKALGYSDRDITAKYLLYGLTASMLGCAAGVLVGFAGFPSVIWFAYSIMYSLPTFRVIFYPQLILASVVISGAIIGLTTWMACRAALKEKAAALLLPKAPAAGKRIFLEYITPLWQRMSFSQKTTARNLLRYKKRFFMTVLGVAGCTALLLVGFGLQDSIMEILDMQYAELTHYDLSVTISSEKALTVEDGLGPLLQTDARVESWGKFYSRTMSLYNAAGREASLTVVAAAENERIAEYTTFRTRLGHKPIPFEENSVILTEKTAETLGLAVGDTIWVQSPAGARVPLTLTGITENYIFSRLFVSEAMLTRILGEVPQWNTVYARTTCETREEASALSVDLLAKNYVTTVAFAEDTTSTFRNVIGNINYVVLLVIVCAAALAAVVLYNLISVNLAERKKELATIKVLGFYDSEVYRYIFREIELLSLIGSVVGLGIGAPLHSFIIRTVEIDQLMFLRAVAPSSYLYSVALTMVFTLGVCFVMRRQVQRISMVESMKAPE